MPLPSDPLRGFRESVRRWFAESFPRPSPAQAKGWPAIRTGRSALILAPTGPGKTLAAFLAAIDRLIFSPDPEPARRLRVLYVSPLKSLAVDVERNLRGPLAGIAAIAGRDGVPFREPAVAIRSGDTPPADRARMRRAPPDILITTPESLYLILTSESRRILASVETIIVDEIHSIAGTKRGAHLVVSLERCEALRPAGARRVPMEPGPPDRSRSSTRAYAGRSRSASRSPSKTWPASARSMGSHRRPPPPGGAAARSGPRSIRGSSR